MRFPILTFLLGFSFLSFAKPNKLPVFNANEQPAAPDYSNPKYWSALPFRKDAADLIPKTEKWINDSLKEVDVFYIYPTLYAKGTTWNADLANKKLNKRLDNLPVKYQASVFNQAGRVYAPRYRQAIIDSYFDTTGSGQKALDFAYEDVKSAFEYYLKHYNNGRPIIIASHSQGTTHSRRLLKDFFDTPEMKAKLVCAYVVGYEINKDNYQILTPCKDAAETNCYVTWSTFKDGFQYKDKLHYFGDVCVNPVSWKMDTVKATSQGGILLNVNRKKKFTTEVHISDAHLLVNTNLTFMRKKDILHLVDFNLFWFDVRKNATLRVTEYLRKNKQ
ncbi:MAG: DUF3089 domain-containing protein [Sphingobacteriales bacterium]|nr:DUF3089 domain-containing protein [Sphingobacteriales bacterium]